MNEKLLEIAFSQYGIKEIPGEENNPEILKYFKEIGHGWVQSEWTAWCSAFVNWVAKEANYEYTGKLNARSWLNVGESLINYKESKREYRIDDSVANSFVDKIQVGDIVILWRISKDSPYGHVGFYINEDKDYVYILGGNQNNEVNISKYPKNRILGYRRLKKLSNE